MFCTCTSKMILSMSTHSIVKIQLHCQFSHLCVQKHVPSLDKALQYGVIKVHLGKRSLTVCTVEIHRIIAVCLVTFAV